MRKQWGIIQDETIMHVIPLDDLIEHEAVDCVCGPRWEEIGGLGDEIIFMITHHSLDGREQIQ